MVSADPARQMPGVQGEVVEAVLAASRVFVAVASNALAGLTPEVTLPQFRAMVLLDQEQSMTMAQLAEALGVASSTATRMCDRLVAKGLVRRAHDRVNRRQVRLTLRPAGRELIAASTRRRKQEIARLMRAIPAEEGLRLAAALRVLIDAASRSTPPPAPRRDQARASQ